MGQLRDKFDENITYVYMKSQTINKHNERKKILESLTLYITGNLHKTVKGYVQ